MKVTLKGNYEGSLYAAEKKALAIMVDTLRASTTIPVLMSKNISELYMAKKVADARLAAKAFETLLVGERDCVPLEGFDYGNSPTEMNSIELFAKNKATFTSSTGSRRVVEAIGAACILIGSPINAKWVAKETINQKEKTGIEEIVILPGYTEGEITKAKITEDQLGAVIIAQELGMQGAVLPKEVKKEITHLSTLLEKQSLHDLLLETDHGKKLLKLGFEKDVEFCAQRNKVSIVPIARNEIETLANGAKIVPFRKNKNKK